MKRLGFLFEDIVSLENLLLAAKKAFRGKKDRTRVSAFYFHLENELMDLHEELTSGTYHPLPYRMFIIHEPKRRQICAADFRDRVVHHAICNVLDPMFERCMIHDTYACRPNKGTHAATAQAQKFARRFNYYLKCDIVKYFHSIDHDVLKTMLASKIKDARLLRLLHTIIDHPLPGGRAGKGLPIGNLTSQYFANFYMGRLDHFLKDRLGVKGYIRYMDDFLLFADDKSALRDHLSSIWSFLSERLRLELKEKAVIVAPVSQGIPFLGFRVFPGLIRLEARKWTRFRRKVRDLESDFLEGYIEKEELSSRVSCMIGHVLHADTMEARKAFFAGSLHLS
ncbi:MAG: reverse transcriptase/maturase family protein [Bacteroidota bacterium]